MASDNIDLRNPSEQKCEVVEGDGTTRSPCDTFKSDDVLYIPTEDMWYLISDKFVKVLNKEADALDKQVKPFIKEIYNEKKSDEKTEKIQHQMLKDLNALGILENYKTRSHMYFLESDEDKKRYAQLIYTRALMKYYLDFYNTDPNNTHIVKVKKTFDKNIQHYADKLGLSIADLSEATPVKQVMKELDDALSSANSHTYSYHAGLKKFAIHGIEKEYLTSLEKDIDKLEKKAKKEAEKEGFTWYTSLQSNKARFINGKDVDIEGNFNSYLYLKEFFIKNYRETSETPIGQGDNHNDKYYTPVDITSSNVERDFENYKYLELFNAGLVAYDAEKFQETYGNRSNYQLLSKRRKVFSIFDELNKKGVVVIEQALTREQLLGKSGIKKEYDKYYQKDDKKVTDKILSWGRKIKDSQGKNLDLSQLNFDKNNPVSLRKKCSDLEGVSFIEKLGYYYLVKFTNFWDKRLTEYLKQVITEIYGQGYGSTENYAEGGFYFLKALRYQADYLIYQGQQNIKDRNLKFCVASSLSKNSMREPALTLEMKDIHLKEYKFVWKTPKTYIVEFFLMSKETRPRYMRNSLLNDLKKQISWGLATPLEIPDLKSADSSKPDLSKMSKMPRGLKVREKVNAAIDSALQNRSLNSKLAKLSDSGFTEYTSAIHVSKKWAGGHNLNYVVSAQAEFFRFCSDSSRINTDAKYPKTFDELSEGTKDRKAKLVSLACDGYVDLAAASISARTMLPSMNGCPMLLPSVVNDGSGDKTRYFHLGQLRFDTNLNLFGSVGIGFALAASADVNTYGGGMRLSPRIPATTNNVFSSRSVARVEGQVDVFAGARFGVSFGFEVRWCKPGKSPQAKNWVSCLEPAKRKELYSTNGYATAPDSNWLPIGSLVESGSLNFGIGYSAGIKFGYAKGKYILYGKAQITYGIGASVDFAIAIYPETLSEIINGLCEVLAQDQFRRVNFFNEKNGYKILNSLITVCMATGIEIAQLALLDITELRNQEKSALMHEHRDTLATQILKFYQKHNGKKDDMNTWVDNMPPEARARVLYTLVYEGKSLTDKLLARAKEINEASLTGKSVKPLTNDEIESLVKGVQEEADQWMAIVRLLERWTDKKDALDRQIEETFTCFNVDGKKRLPFQYGNKIMPVIAWERIKGFLQRGIDCWVSDEKLISKYNRLRTTDNGRELFVYDAHMVNHLNKIINKFDSYFFKGKKPKYKKVIHSMKVPYTLTPNQELIWELLSDHSNSSKIKIKEGLTKHEFEFKVEYYIYTGSYKKDNYEIKEELKYFIYYHLARKVIYPQEYDKLSKNLVKFVTDNEGWHEELNEELAKYKKDKRDQVKKAIMKAIYIKLKERFAELEKAKKDAEDAAKRKKDEKITYYPPSNPVIRICSGGKIY